MTGPVKRVVPDLNRPICIDDDDYEDEEYDDVTTLEHIPSMAEDSDISGPKGQGRSIFAGSNSEKEAYDDPILSEAAKLDDRLRKRKLAETERMLEQERRQKQRVEELRNARKKEEENAILKDKIRAVVCKKLERVKNSSRSMASALRFLGIKVDGWPKPSTEDIQNAYKKALFTFHPDRQSGIPEKAEAEEILKFVINYKKNFGLSYRTYA